MMTVFEDKNGSIIELGDMVTCSRYMPHHREDIVGHVAVIRNELRLNPIGVDFGAQKGPYHILGGRIPNSTGYWLPSKCITVISRKDILGDDDDDCI